MKWGLVVIALLACAQAGAKESADERYVMTISGGLSYGAYDAGRNWVFLRYLQEKRGDSENHGLLGAVSGASAGAINAFTTALSWCTTDEARVSGRPLLSNTLDDNAFRSIWTSVSFETLLPASADGTGVDNRKYSNGPGKEGHPDGLLSRKNAFESIIPDLQAWFELPGAFHDGCRVPIGIALTRTEPLPVRVFRDFQHALPQQTVYAMLELRVGPDGNAAVYMLDGDALDRDVEFGDRHYRFDGSELRLPVRDGEPLTFAQIESLLYASSAFPVAFGRVYISHCVPSGGPDCGTPVENVPFVDGGVFDNIPIGLALALANSEDLPPARFFYIDPDIRRVATEDCERDDEHGKCSKAEPDRYPFDFASQIGFLSGAIGHARSMNRAQVLHDVCGVASVSCDGMAIVAARGKPIVAETAGAFGAFFDQRFAEYDYLRGVYDGLFTLQPEKVCPGCTDVESIAEHLEMDDLESQNWRTVAWMAGIPDGSPTDQEKDIHDALEAAQRVPGGGDPRYYIEAPFERFAAGLKEQEFSVGDNALLESALRNPEHWYTRIAQRALNRLRYLEDRENYLRERRDSGADEDDAGALRRLIALAEIYSHELPGGRPTTDWQPTVNPRKRWIPYYSGIETRNGMLNFTQPVFRRAGNWRIEPAVSLAIDVPALAADDGSRVVAAAGVGIGRAMPFAPESVFRVGAGVRAYWDLDHARRSETLYPAATLFADLFDKLRVELVYRDIDGSPSGDRWLFNLTFIDTPSLFGRFTKEELLDGTGE